ncbi:hypothetical protein CLOHYLEM_05749 [[Clostridium] hylemonae DSM 15053]|uniref:Uncharacterized protein n=1 Tax=[Clostridium] hylemonae DSM 15053 TaxID=553973 RepID=C0C290_9FIRM|nr:hypothetical protein CLOHYLEM_05749 [[Clostridium] hylemonae DSM 15053]
MIELSEIMTVFSFYLKINGIFSDSIDLLLIISAFLLIIKF